MTAAARRARSLSAHRQARPARRRPRKRKATGRSDLTIAALGITLGLICALFPWYIFFNQEKFGVRAMKFEGGGDAGTSGPIAVGPQPQRVGAPMTVEDIPVDAARPVRHRHAADGRQRRTSGKRAPASTEQPFPGDDARTSGCVHVANGRAMIEDDAGLWIVQRGSMLPDRQPRRRDRAARRQMGSGHLDGPGHRAPDVARRLSASVAAQGPRKTGLLGLCKSARRFPCNPSIFSNLAAKQSQWLAVRQSTIAGNIANANTPGYRRAGRRAVREGARQVPASPWPRPRSGHRRRRRDRGRLRGPAARRRRRRSCRPTTPSCSRTN